MRAAQPRLREAKLNERHWSISANATARLSSTTSTSRKTGSRRKTSLRQSPTSSYTNPCPPATHKAHKAPVQTWTSPIITASPQFASGSDSAPSSPMPSSTSVFESAPNSPMLQSSEWSTTSPAPTPEPTSATSTATEAGSVPFGDGPSAQQTAEDTAQAGHDGNHSGHTATMLIAGGTALGSLLVLSALLWALIVRAKRGQRRKHLADVLEKVGTSPSSSTTNISRKDSFGNLGPFSPRDWDDLAEKAVGLPSATSDLGLQKDASFCWKYPTLSIPPAAARAMTETHYVKRRSTMPARPKNDSRQDGFGQVQTSRARDPPLRDPLADPIDPPAPYINFGALSIGDEDGHEEEDDDGPPAWLIALAEADPNFASTLPGLSGSVSAPSTSAASDSEARKGWLNFVIPPTRRTTTPYNSHVSLAPTARSLGSVYSTPASPQLPPMVVPSITITVDDGDFGIIDRPLSLDDRGYDSESAEECLDPDEFPTIPRWESQLRRF
ncbi:hypothetical protein V8E36_005679 [Tilletia maclaganii]